MRRTRGFLALAFGASVVFAACSGGGASEAPASEAPASEAPASEAPASEAPASEAPAAAAVRLQLQWVPQAQFAGYYVAKDKGFYEEEGLDVTILPGGPDIAPTQVLAGGGADVIVEWMPAALAAREKGLPLVNIAQPFKASGMMLTCLKESGITDPKTDFKGKTLDVWFSGN